MLALLAVGATALAAWCIGAAALPARAERALRVTAACALAVYAAVVVAVRDDFGVAVAFYLPAAVFLLGAWAAFWFMAGELPNSFLKRRWGVAPGEVPSVGARRALCLALDRVDSILAMLIALSLAVPLAWLTWLYVLVLGAGVHFLFSALLCLARVKKRIA